MFTLDIFISVYLAPLFEVTCLRDCSSSLILYLLCMFIFMCHAVVFEPTWTCFASDLMFPIDLQSKVSPKKEHLFKAAITGWCIAPVLTWMLLFWITKFCSHDKKKANLVKHVSFFHCFFFCTRNIFFPPIVSFFKAYNDFRQYCELFFVVFMDFFFYTSAHFPTILWYLSHREVHIMLIWASQDYILDRVL